MIGIDALLPAGIVLLAAYLSGCRAWKVDPMVAIGYEQGDWECRSQVAADGQDLALKMPPGMGDRLLAGSRGAESPTQLRRTAREVGGDVAGSLTPTFGRQQKQRTPGLCDFPAF